MVAGFHRDDASVLLAVHLGYGQEKGTNTFLAWIRSYVKNFTYKPANTHALIAILEKMTGESWQACFEQYLFGTDPSPVK